MTEERFNELKEKASHLQGIRSHAEQHLTALQWVEKHHPEHFEDMKEFSDEVIRQLMENRRVRNARLQAEAEAKTAQKRDN